MSEAPTNIRFLPVTEATAWRAYLDATAAADADGYVEIEQVAWEQLQAALGQLAADPVGAA